MTTFHNINETLTNVLLLLIKKTCLLSLHKHIIQNAYLNGKYLSYRTTSNKRLLNVNIDCILHQIYFTTTLINTLSRYISSIVALKGFELISTIMLIKGEFKSIVCLQI